MKDLNLSPLEIYNIIKCSKFSNFVELVANGPRPDGTYNNCRKALEIKAKQILKDLKELKEEIHE